LTIAFPGNRKANVDTTCDMIFFLLVKIKEREKKRENRGKGNKKK
jgi:hypothetical protein